MFRGLNPFGPRFPPVSLGPNPRLLPYPFKGIRITLRPLLVMLRSLANHFDPRFLPVPFRGKGKWTRIHVYYPIPLRELSGLYWLYFEAW